MVVIWRSDTVLGQCLCAVARDPQVVTVIQTQGSGAQVEGVESQAGDGGPADSLLPPAFCLDWEQAS